MKDMTVKVEFDTSNDEFRENDIVAIAGVMNQIRDFIHYEGRGIGSGYSSKTKIKDSNGNNIGFVELFM